MFVLGVDPGLDEGGWCKIWMEPNEPVRLVDSGRIRTNTDQPNTVRYLLHRDTLQRLISDPDLDVVSVEQPPPQSSYSAGLYPIFIFTKLLSMYHRVDLAYFTPTVLKADARHVLGKDGRGMSKKEMKEAAEILVGDGTDFNHHIADAIHAAYTGGRLYQLIYGDITDEDLTEREDYSFTKIVNHRDGTTTYKGAVYKQGDSHESTYTRFTSPKYDHLYLT